MCTVLEFGNPEIHKNNLITIPIHDLDFDKIYYLLANTELS